MRKLVVALFLAVLASNAVAGWTFIAQSDAVTEYADTTAIRRSGSTVKMWTLSDYSEPQSLADGGTSSSSVALMEFDCAEGRSRTLQMSMYSGPMRQGKVVSSYGVADEWSYPIPGSIADVDFKWACKNV